MELARAARRPVTMVSVRHNPVRPDEHRRILAKVEAAWREGLRLHPQGTCSPLTSTFTITNGFVFGRYKAWRRVLEAKPSEWRAILADPGFRGPESLRESVRHTALFNGDIVPLRIKRVVKPELQRFTGKSVVELARDTEARRQRDRRFPGPGPRRRLPDGIHVRHHEHRRRRGGGDLHAPDRRAGSLRRRRSHHSVLGGGPDEPAPRPLGARAASPVARGRGAPCHGGTGGDLRHSRPWAPAPASPPTSPSSIPWTIACHEEEIVHDMPDGGPRYIARASGLQWSFVNGQPIIRDGRLPELEAVSGAGRVIRAA